MKTKTILLAIFCSICFYNQMDAQNNNGPTLTQTIDFIKLKTTNLHIYFNTYKINHPDESIKYYYSVDDKIINCLDKVTEINNMEGNYPVFISSNVGNWKFYMQLDLTKIESIEIVDNKWIKFTSSKPFIDCTIDDEAVTALNSNMIMLIPYNEDAPKLLKAWKHLFDLKGIKLTGDLF